MKCPLARISYTLQNYAVELLPMCDPLMAPTTWGKELTSLNAPFASLVSASPFGNLM